MKSLYNSPELFPRREKGRAVFTALKQKFVFVCFVFQDRASLYSPDCPGIQTHYADQAGGSVRVPDQPRLHKEILP